MRIILLIFSVVISVVLSILGINQFQDARNENINIAQLENRIDLIKNARAKIQNFKISEATPLTLGFKEFHNFVKLIAEYHKADALLSIPGYRDQQNIEEYFAQSELQGVKKLNLKVSFNKLKDPLSFVSILSALHDTAKNISFEIISITSKTESLEIVVNLYGV